MSTVAPSASTVSSDNVVATTLFMQVVLIGIIALSSAMSGNLYAAWSPSYRRVDRSSYGAVILVFALVTIAILIFSDAFTKNWGPILGSPPVQISASHAVRDVFVVDTLAVAFLVFNTGGAEVSPFTPVFFLLPTIALLLGESQHRVIFYTALGTVCFTVCMLRSVYLKATMGDKDDASPFALWFVTISAFWLAVYIGLLPNSR